MIAALFVDTNGAYYGLANVDPWDKARDAREYRGLHAVVAHPPCERWGRYWHGSPSNPHQFRRGEDSGCFAAALTSVRNYGGVLEHVADSGAWEFFGLTKPERHAGWTKADRYGFTCYVEQGHYGHAARKGSWLYGVGFEPPQLVWEPAGRAPTATKECPDRTRRLSLVEQIGGTPEKKKRARNATPLPFRDLLLSMAERVAA